jgi:hypothetical protein
LLSNVEFEIDMGQHNYQQKKLKIKIKKSMKHAKQIELYCAILCQTTQKGTKRAQNDKPKNVLGQSSF